MRKLRLIKGHRYFESQERGEEVLLLVRMHWLILVAPFFIGMFIFGVLYLFAALIFANTTQILAGVYLESVQAGISGVILLFGVLYIYGSWLVRYLNVLILTNEHIVDVTQIAFFSRKESTLSLESIEDVAITKKGFFQNIFDYGDILIQTAGELPNFDLDKIADPEGVQRMIMEAKENFQNHPHH
jgi:uncharacterized membrane protein YdbT with pleckstrin-like domain